MLDFFVSHLDSVQQPRAEPTTPITVQSTQRFRILEHTWWFVPGWPGRYITSYLRVAELPAAHDSTMQRHALPDGPVPLSTQDLACFRSRGASQAGMTLLPRRFVLLAARESREWLSLRSPGERILADGDAEKCVVSGFGRRDKNG